MIFTMLCIMALVTTLYFWLKRVSMVSPVKVIYPKWDNMLSNIDKNSYFTGIQHSIWSDVKVRGDLC